MTSSSQIPTTISGKTENIRNSHINGYREEIELANRLAESGRVVLKWGDEIGKHGNDIITVHPKTGAVEFWDSKFRSNPTTGKTSPTYTNKGRLENAKTEAIDYILDSNLPPAIKTKQLKMLIKTSSACVPLVLVR